MTESSTKKPLDLTNLSPRQQKIVDYLRTIPGEWIGDAESNAKSWRGTEAQPRSAGSQGSAVEQDAAKYGLESYTNRDIVEPCLALG